MKKTPDTNIETIDNPTWSPAQPMAIWGHLRPSEAPNSYRSKWSGARCPRTQSASSFPGTAHGSGSNSFRDLHETNCGPIFGVTGSSKKGYNYDNIIIQSWYKELIWTCWYKGAPNLTLFWNTVHPTRLSEPDSNGVLNAEDLLSDHTEHLAGLISMDWSNSDIFKSYSDRICIGKHAYVYIYIISIKHSSLAAYILLHVINIFTSTSFFGSFFSSSSGENI